jgi:hypothetical protein
VTGPLGNPMLERYVRWRADPSVDDPDTWRSQYGFAMPDDRALGLIAEGSPNGTIELGAGTGYWARLLHDRGVDVVAYDLAPPPSQSNEWFAGQTPWFPVLQGDERVVQAHPERTLLLVWPTRDEDWPATAASIHLRAGGQRLIYVGEPPGGATGDLRFHTAIGLLDHCLACTYGAAAAPCTCSVTARWSLLTQVPLPNWRGQDDYLFILRPGDPPQRKKPWRR